MKNVPATRNASLDIVPFALPRCRSPRSADVRRLENPISAASRFRPASGRRRGRMRRFSSIYGEPPPTGEERSR